MTTLVHGNLIMPYIFNDITVESHRYECRRSSYHRSKACDQSERPL
jgi:hypothetical protein